LTGVAVGALGEYPSAALVVRKLDQILRLIVLLTQLSDHHDAVIFHDEDLTFSWIATGISDVEAPWKIKDAFFQRFEEIHDVHHETVTHRRVFICEEFLKIGPDVLGPLYGCCSFQASKQLWLCWGKASDDGGFLVLVIKLLTGMLVHTFHWKDVSSGLRQTKAGLVPWILSRRQHRVCEFVSLIELSELSLLVEVLVFSSLWKHLSLEREMIFLLHI
jgi:hypothetical protein